VQKHHAEIEQLGGQVLAISFTPAAKAAAFLEKHPLPFPVLCDPEREGYRTFELGRTSWGQILRPRIIGRYVRAILRGRRPIKPNRGDDVLQLGGDFVLDAQRRLVYAHRSADVTDRPSVEVLLEAVRSAVGVIK
jgi:peroxiredoxin